MSVFLLEIIAGFFLFSFVSSPLPLSEDEIDDERERGLKHKAQNVTRLCRRRAYGLDEVRRCGDKVKKSFIRKKSRSFVFHLPVPEFLLLRLSETSADDGLTPWTLSSLLFQ